jgi:hypothetical protein
MLYRRAHASAREKRWREKGLYSEYQPFATREEVAAEQANAAAAAISAAVAKGIAAASAATANDAEEKELLGAIEKTTLA